MQNWLPMGGGAMGELIRRRDWSRTPVGSPDSWPQSLRTALGIMLDSGYAMYIAWGPEFIQFYNDAYRPILGDTKHPAALGQSTRVCFSEIWDFIGPMFQRVLDLGENTTLTNQLLRLNRFGYAEECYFTFSYSAIRDERSGVGGVLVTVIETTQSVVGERRERTLRELAAYAGQSNNEAEAAERIQHALRRNLHDLPFASLHLHEQRRPAAGLMDLPADEVIESPAWPGEFVRKAILIPLASDSAAGEKEYLLAGLSPALQFDSAYQSFLNLAGAQVSSMLESARAYAAERKRAEALVELDRAKTSFFSNVSHEFRTPLTLLLAPLEDAIAYGDALPGELGASLAMAHRNALRLLKLVNMLLEFSRIEAGRVHVAFEPVDLARYTGELASIFESIVVDAGLSFRVHCPPLPQPVFVDREMWEKIVLNLLSNAFKYTLEGGIAVTLSHAGEHVVLEVSDTGTGISQHELPLVLERFHRVEGARGRTIEGTGIGLALVNELVQMHGGQISIESEEGRGSAFRVSVPYGSAQLHPGPVTERRAVARPAAFAEEARHWSDTAIQADRPPEEPEGRVLFADDNADLRQYVSRVLGKRFTVLTVPDGKEALNALESFQPHLVLSDVMMPGMNGYELLSAIRADEKKQFLPVILLSARAGEEARIEGLNAGADDYLVKPFSGRELMARVSSQITIAKLRRAAHLEQSRFRDTLMQAPAAIALLRGPGHVFELVNEEYLHLVGKSNPADLIGRSVAEVLPEVRTQGYIDLLDGVFRGGESYIGREVPLLIEGASEQIYLNFVYQAMKNDAGQTEGILVHASDVSDLIRSRSRIEESERQLRTLADSIPQLVWTCLPDGNCDFLSAQWLRYTGIAEQDQLGLQWLDRVMHPDDRERTYKAWMAAVADRMPYDIEYRLRRFDGAFRWFKTRGTPARNSDGRIEKWFGTCTDIEDQKLAEQHMLQQQKLESVGLLAGGIAHDFNNLLVGVLGNASLIEESLPAGHALRPMVDGIVEAGERAAHLTRQMLAYAGKGRMYVERLDVTALARSTSGLVEASFPKSVRLILETDPSTPAIEADSGQVQQVIMNLAINGAEAVSAETGGSVCIRIFGVVVDEAYKATHRFASETPREGSYACIEVRDTGSGVKPDALSKIFDPFFTTKFTGRGLGLAAVMGIVRATHGAIELCSVPGEGSTFRVLLPAAATETSPVKPEAPGPREKPDGGPLVLVIDDEEIVRRTTTAALRKNGYSVVQAADGRAGLDLFSVRATEIALVILDMSMPGMSGKQVLEHLRKLDSRVPVLIFSGFSEDEVHRQFAGMNISGFVQKPFTIHQLASAVHELLRQALAD